MIGRQIGNYKIVSQLGEGGMGMVYKAEHVSLGQIVAVKSLHPTLMGNQAARDRFEREAQALARLNHPNIIKLLDYISTAEGCFLVMEFAEGDDLEQKLQRMGLIPPEQCLPWFVGACKGLSYAHQKNIIHRDIKPSNIMVHPSGVTKLLDFGTAKVVDAQRLTQQGMTLGTVIYMSKEQLLGKPLDPRSDVYSLGVTLYECLTGQLPFYDEEERKLVVKIAKEDPIPPSQHYPGIKPDLEAVILRSMTKDPNQRYQSAEEFEQALSRLLGGAVTNMTSAAQPVPAVAGHGGGAPASPTPPQPGPAAAPPSSGGGAAPWLSPLFLIGVFLALIGLAAGLPLLIVGEGVPRYIGAAILPLFLLMGGVMVIAALVRSTSGGSAGAAAKPTAPQGSAGGKPACPSCGRVLLAGMAECPFCNPQAAAAPAPSMPQPAAAPAPQPMAFDPGGTLNVNSAHAAQSLPMPQMPQAAVAQRGGVAVSIVDGNEKGRMFQLSPGRFTIGRAPDCGCTLSDPGVSGHHAAIVLENGALFVEDTGSRNGVFVNNQRIQRQPLSSGDLVVIGSTRMLVTVG